MLDLSAWNLAIKQLRKRRNRLGMPRDDPATVAVALWMDLDLFASELASELIAGAEANLRAYYASDHDSHGDLSRISVDLVTEWAERASATDRANARLRAMATRPNQARSPYSELRSLRKAGLVSTRQAVRDLEVRGLQDDLLRSSLLDVTREIDHRLEAIELRLLAMMEAPGRIREGSRVTINFHDGGQEVVVVTDSADHRPGTVRADSPLGIELYGRTVGATVMIPGGGIATIAAIE